MLRLSGGKKNKNHCWEDNKQVSATAANGEVSNSQNVESPLKSEDGKESRVNVSLLLSPALKLIKTSRQYLPCFTKHSS